MKKPQAGTRRAPAAAPAPVAAADAIVEAAAPAEEPASAEEPEQDPAPEAAPAEPEAEEAEQVEAHEEAAAPAEEHVVEGFIDGDTLVPMSHPDNGSIDGVDIDEDGNFLVRAIDVPTYVSHGFVPAAGDIS